jgi:hypothetical protein
VNCQGAIPHSVLRTASSSHGKFFSRDNASRGSNLSFLFFCIVFGTIAAAAPLVMHGQEARRIA